jgi:hypothetical protein
VYAKDKQSVCSAEIMKHILGHQCSNTTIRAPPDQADASIYTRAVELISPTISKPRLRLSRAKTTPMHLHSKTTVTPEEKDKFAASLNMYVVATFLAPQPPSSSTPINKHIASAISNPQRSNTLDWAKYTAQSVKKAASNMQKQLSSKCRGPPISRYSASKLWHV